MHLTGVTGEKEVTVESCMVLNEVKWKGIISFIEILFFSNND